MHLYQVAADVFLRYTCECCGVTYGGTPLYRAGLLQCRSCASGSHRHERVAEAA